MAGLSLCACTTATSHPRALGSAAPIPLPSAIGASSIRAAESPSSLSPSATTASPPVAVSPAGTPSGAAVLSPGALSSADIAAGVRATAQEFFADLNIAFATGDVSKVEAITSPACGCRSLINTIKTTYANKQRIVGVTASVKSLSVVSFIPAGATADTHYQISAGQVVDANGHQVNTSVEDPDEHSAMFITSEHGSWIIQQNTLLNGPTK
jgi:hypothetical protein